MLKIAVYSPKQTIKDQELSSTASKAATGQKWVSLKMSNVLCCKFAQQLRCFLSNKDGHISGLGLSEVV